MRVTRRALLKTLITAGVGGLTGTGAYGYMYARRALQLTTQTLTVNDLPAALAGLRVGFLSDVHRSQWVSEFDVRRAVDEVMAQRPDLIVLGGDYVTWGDRRYVDAAAESLTGLSAPHGVFAVLGNHDDDRDVPAALARHGIEVLRDARTRRRIHNEDLDLVGIRFWTRRASEIAPLVRGVRGPIVLLAHDPRRLIEASSLDIPLVLSGHTHGGQVVLTVVGAVAARKFPILAGTATLGDTRIFVSRGVGTVYLPVRIGCPPEVAILTLQPAGDRA